MPSPDGNLVAVSMSRSGSELGDLSIYESETGAVVYEAIPRVNAGTAGGDLAWLPDGSGFFYTRYPREGERVAEDLDFYQQLWFHTLGQPVAEDRYELGEGFPKIGEIRLEMDEKTGRLLLTVQNGDGGEFEHYVRQSDGRWSQFSNFDDEVVEATFGPSGELFVLSFEDAPKGKLLAIESADPDMTRARVILPESDGALESSFWDWFSPSFLATDSRLFAIYQVGGPTELRVFDLTGSTQDAPEQLEVSTVYSLTPIAGNEIMFANQSFVDPKRWFRFDGGSGETSETPLSSNSPVDFSSFEVLREFATSRDGTQIPVNIIRSKQAQTDGSSPVLVTGYGGYGASQSPFLVTVYTPLLEQGFTIAKVNLRGGSEFGKEWHEQGRLTKKQNVFDDFAAAIEHLLAEGYADPGKVAILGGSNGGLLMGALMTQHPDHE
jgi:prolyl oligopeptidase